MKKVSIKRKGDQAMNEPKELHANQNATHKPSTEHALNLFLAIKELGAILPSSFYEQLIYFNEHGDKDVRPKKGRQSIIQKINDQKLLWLASRATAYTNPNGALKKIHNLDSLNARLKEIKNGIKDKSRDELVNEYSNITVRLERIEQELQSTKDEIQFLSQYALSKLETRKTIVEKQKSFKNALFQDNHDCLLECIKIIESESQDFPRKYHYRKFYELVTELYPTKPFKQAGPLSKEEKLQPKNIQEINRIANKNEKWSTSTLRNFFEAYIGKKIASLEK